MSKKVVLGGFGIFALGIAMSVLTYSQRGKIAGIKNLALEKGLLPNKSFSKRVDSSNFFKNYNGNPTLESIEQIRKARRSLKSALIDKKTYKTKTSKNHKDQKFSKIKNLRTIDKINITQANEVDSIAYIFKPTKDNKKLIIFHQGHPGGFDDSREAIEVFIKHGFSVLAYSMPFLGMNTKPEIFKYYGQKQEVLLMYEDENKSFISYFITPVIVGLDETLKFNTFESIGMVGISGGGWTTVLTAAVDERVSQSFPIAGSLPINLRTYDIGDIEEIYPSFYSKYPYLNLYLLGSVNDKGKKREQFQISYMNDTCCFSGDRSKLYENSINNTAKKLNGRFSVVIEDESIHKVHNRTAEFISQKIKKWNSQIP